jgi:hypothetical protein
MLSPLIDKDVTTIHELTAFLEATYGDPNRKATAQTRLAALKQGKRSFLAHFAEFRRLAVDAGLNDDAQILQLRVSLNSELQKAMIGCRIPGTVTEYANLIASYDNDLFFLRSRPENTRRSNTHSSDAMDIDAMDYAPLNSSERERRRRRGLCFKCGSADHLSPNCNKPIPGRTDSRHQVRTVSTTSRSPPTQTNSDSNHRPSRRNSTSSHSSSASASSQRSKGPSRN